MVNGYLDSRYPFFDKNMQNHIDKILAFLHEVGIPCHLTTLPDSTFLPGIDIVNGTLHIDLDKLQHPGDILHEAGHIAVAEPADRSHLCGNVSKDKTESTAMGEEMMAIAWSYAALVKLGLPPEVVFHPQGYKGHSEWYIENYTGGNYLGLPLMQWAGFCAKTKEATEQNYPNMLCWLRP